MRAWLVVVCVLLSVLGASPAAAAPAGPAVVVLGVAGLRWSDVSSRTPALQSLARTGAVGALSVKGLPAVTCAGDGWLTLGAGARARQFGRSGPCTAELPDDAQRQRTENARTRDGARTGALHEALLKAMPPVDALLDPVSADGEGARVAVGWPADVAGGFDEPPFAPVLRLVDLGVVDDVDRSGDLARVDRALAAQLRRAGGSTDLLVVGLSEGTGEDTARLHPALATGPSFPAGALTSASTRRTPYVQLIDVAPTVLRLLDVDVPEAMDGQPWTSKGPAPSVAELRDLSDRAVVAKRTTVPFFVVALGALLLLLLGLRRRPKPLRLVALAGVALPVASYVAMLVPWWRATVPLVALLAVTAVLSAGAALLLRRTVLVLLLAALVMGVDLAAGAPLQLDSPAGYSPLVAGRFAGLGNVAFGVYGTCWLLGTALLVGARPRRANTLRLAGLGLVAVLLDGGPAWGSDVGGVLALLPAFVVLGLLLSGRRVSVLRIAAACVGAAALVAVLALVDLSRPSDRRTHLGRFGADVRDGTAGDLLARKAHAVLALLFHSPVTAALPLVVAAAVWLVLRPPAPLRATFERVPALRAGLQAVGVMSLLGFVLNDSGAAVPALALLVAVPATVAVAARVVELRVPPPDEAATPVA